MLIWGIYVAKSYIVELAYLSACIESAEVPNEDLSITLMNSSGQYILDSKQWASFHNSMAFQDEDLSEPSNFLTTNTAFV